MNPLYRLVQSLYHRLFRRDPLGEYVRNGLIVGKRFHMMEEVIIDCSHTWHIEIGDDVTLAPRVHILAHDASTKQHLNFTRIGKVTIGNRVFIGASSIILPGVSIGSDVIIGAGSVVTRDIPDGQIATGNPARVVESLAEFFARRKKEMEVAPCFGKEYTMGLGVTDTMKDEMNRRMKDRFGYIA